MSSSCRVNVSLPVGCQGGLRTLATVVLTLLGWTGHAIAQSPRPPFRHGLFGVLPGASGAVAVSDLNGDGRPDVAVAQTSENVIAVYLAKGGNGAFDHSRDFQAGSRPRALVAGDFNRDGREDLVVLNYLSHDVSVLLGRGDGTFELPRSFSLGTGTYPLSLVAADFDRDGDLDVAATGGYRVFVLLGSGNGELSAPTSIPTGNLPWGIAWGLGAGDFDSDGNTDLVVTRLNDYDLSILLGTGSGSFVPGPIYGVEKFPEEVVVLDLDRDGNLDLVVNSREARGVSVLLGDGRAGFAPKPVIPASRYPVGLVVADFDGDGRFDLALGEAYDRRRLLFFPGNGDGTFQEPRVISEAYAAPLAALDLNADGRRDLLVNNPKGLLLYVGDGSGGFRPPAIIETNRYPSVVVATDLDSNGAVDLVVGTDWSAKIDVFRGAGDGSFLKAPGLSPSGPVRGVAVADLDRDGRQDLAVSTAAASCISVGGVVFPCPGPNLSVFIGRGDGSLGRRKFRRCPKRSRGGW